MMTDEERQKLIEMVQKYESWPASSIIPRSFQMAQIIKLVDGMLAERVKYT